MTFELPDTNELRTLAASMGLSLDDRQTETLRYNGLAVNTNGFNSPGLEKYLSGWQHRLAQRERMTRLSTWR